MIRRSSVSLILLKFELILVLIFLFEGVARAFSPVKSSNKTMNKSNETILCELATNIRTDTYKTIISIEIILASLSIAPNIFLLSAVRSVTVFPPNLRLLISHFNFILLYFSCSTILNGIYLLSTAPCSFNITARQCRILSFLVSGFPLPNIYYALFSLCIERLYATVNFRKYDNNRKPWLAIGLICFSWLLVICFTGMPGFIEPNSDEMVPFCYSIFLHDSGSNRFYLYLILEWIGAMVTVFIYYYNRYLARCMVINRALFDLPSRFMVDQNVQVNVMLVPSVALHVIVHLLTFLVLIPSMAGTVVHLNTRIYLLRSSFIWRLIYTILDPIISLSLNVHLREHLLNGPIGRILTKMGMKSKKENRSTPVLVQGAVHFAYLNRLWEKKTHEEAKRARKIRSNRVCPANIP